MTILRLISSKDVIEIKMFSLRRDIFYCWRIRIPGADLEGGVRGVRPPPPPTTPLKFAKYMLYNVN